MSESGYKDPVVAEIHAIRAQLLAECEDDYQKFMEQLRKEQRASGRRVILPPPVMPCGAEQATSPMRSTVATTFSR